MDEKIVNHCPGCPNHCPEDGLSCVIGMTHFNKPLKPYWIKKEDDKQKEEKK